MIVVLFNFNTYRNRRLMSQIQCYNQKPLSPFSIMHRSYSHPSLFTMSQFGAPYTFEMEDFDLPDGAQQLPDGAHEPAYIQDSTQSEYSDSQSEEPPPPLSTTYNVNDIVFTNTAELRTVLATLTGYQSGQLGSHLRNFHGLIILPLDAVTILRTPQAHHCKAYNCITFVPHQNLPNYSSNLPNFCESINVIYQH